MEIDKELLERLSDEDLSKCLDEELLERLDDLSEPHQDAMYDTVKTAFPDRCADEMYTIMIAVRLSRLLGLIDGSGMFGLRDILNAVLAARIGYVVTGVEDTDYDELYRKTAELRV